MEHSDVQSDSSIYKSTARAEDGMQHGSNRDALTEGVLIPVATLFAVLVTMLGMMLLNR